MTLYVCQTLNNCHGHLSRIVHLLPGRLATVNPLLNALYQYPAGSRVFVFEHEEKSKAKVMAISLFAISKQSRVKSPCGILVF